MRSKPDPPLPASSISTEAQQKMEFPIGSGALTATDQSQKSTRTYNGSDPKGSSTGVNLTDFPASSMVSGVPASLPNDINEVRRTNSRKYRSATISQVPKATAQNVSQGPSVHDLPSRRGPSRPRIASSDKGGAVVANERDISLCHTPKASWVRVRSPSPESSIMS